MMNVEELEGRIKEEKVKLAILNEKLEKAEEGKTDKLEYQVSRQDEIIDKLIERQQNLLDKEVKDEEKDNPKDKNAEEEDLDVCEECGSDLQLIGTDENGVDIYECISCGELYLDG